MKRSKHGLSHQKLLTCDMGELVPVGLVEVLPGDTIQHSTSLLIRLQPTLAPVMHNVEVRIHHYYVPNRLVMPTWADFITGGSDGLGNGAVIPTNGAGITPAVGSLLDYMGVPTGNLLPAGSLSLLPVRGYNAIYNEFYRDEDLITAVSQDSTTLQKISWEKDYFTTCRPWTQKGPAVTLPLGTEATIKTKTTDILTGAQNPLRLSGATAGGKPAASTLAIAPTSGNMYYNAVAGGGTVDSVYPANLYADLSTATAATVNQLRLSLAIQRYQEARAQYGSRFTEYLRYLGIKSSDQRLDRPEYLGGGKQNIAFSEVLRTASDSGTNPIGELRGHGIAALRSNRYRYFVEEHGYIHTLLSIRPRAVYNNGIDRTWTKRTKEDFYQKELELIGQQSVFNRELYMTGVAADNNVFGYQDRYAEYRSQQSKIAGEYRTTLDFWHMARKFAALPTLNQAFIECDATKRIHAVTSTDACWLMVAHSIQARRLVGNRTIGRIL